MIYRASLILAFPKALHDFLLPLGPPMMYRVTYLEANSGMRRRRSRRKKTRRRGGGRGVILIIVISPENGITKLRSNPNQGCLYLLLIDVLRKTWICFYNSYG